MNTLQLLVCLAFACYCCANKCNVTNQIKDDISSNGSELVNAIIWNIECRGLFHDENMFMRRLAYVETKDGAEGQGRKGIWNVSTYSLGDMKLSALASNTTLLDQICDSFGMDMEKAVGRPDKQNLTDPLVSGVITAFYLKFLTVEKGQQIPSAENVSGQATFWVTNIKAGNKTATRDHFSRRVAELKEKCWCSNRGGCCPLPEEWKNSNNANGSEVVETVLQRLEESHIFSPDYGFMRRIAYVETRDGTVTTAANNTCRVRRGIWGITEYMLYHMKRSNLTKMFAVSEAICKEFGVNMIGHEKLNMRNPLVSAIAARFYLLFLTDLENEDLPEDLMGQALFWGSHYTKINAHHKKFSEDVLELEGCRVNADIMFVMDISHSIDDIHLDEVFIFMKNFVQNLTIGPLDNRVGAIVFGDHALVMFNMSQNRNKTDLMDAIDKIKIDSEDIRSGVTQNTNTFHGLKETISIFQSDARTSNTVFRVAIVLSDGVSDDPDATIREAAKLRNLSVLVYAIGVGSVNEKEMRAIASDYHHYTHLDHFDSEEFKAVRKNYSNDICLSETEDITCLKHFEGDLDQEEIMRYSRLVPSNGLTIRVCFNEGRVTVSVFCLVPDGVISFKAVCERRNSTKEDSCQCIEVYVPGSVSSEDLEPEHNHFKRETATTEVHITIEGMETENVFVVDTTDGDNPNDCVGTEVADDCIDPEDSHGPTPSPSKRLPDSQSASKGPSKKTVVIAATVSSTGFILICCVVIVTSVGGWVLYRCRKQQQQQKEKEEEEFKLLDNEYVEM